jgi:iron complex outermembrane receptor protein
MLTWPDVKTFNQALYVEDKYELNDTSSLKMLASVAYHQNKVDSQMGLESLQIFILRECIKKQNFEKHRFELRMEERDLGKPDLLW